MYFFCSILGLVSKLSSYFMGDISLPTKVHLVRPIPGVMYGCERWTIKKSKCWRIDAFELWCWRRLLRAPWTARRSNHSILKEISSENSLKGLMLKLKLQYFGHLMLRTDSLEKTVMLGKIEGRRRRGLQRMRYWWHHWLDIHKSEQTLGVGDGQERKPDVLQFMGLQKSWTILSDWTKKWKIRNIFS